MSAVHPVRQLAPASLNVGLRADSGRSFLRRQAAWLDPELPLAEADVLGSSCPFSAIDRSVMGSDWLRGNAPFEPTGIDQSTLGCLGGQDLAAAGFSI